MDMVVPFNIGLLCMIFGIRARKYRKMGAKDPYRWFLLTLISMLTVICLILFIRALHQL